MILIMPFDDDKFHIIIDSKGLNDLRSQYAYSTNPIIISFNNFMFDLGIDKLMLFGIKSLDEPKNDNIVTITARLNNGSVRIYHIHYDVTHPIDNTTGYYKKVETSSSQPTVDIYINKSLNDRKCVPIIKKIILDMVQ